MNIGIYVTSLTPKSPAQAHFQRAVFAGLKKLKDHRHHFCVFSYEVPPGFQDDAKFTYQPLEREGRWTRARRILKSRIGRIVLFGCSFCGVDSGRFKNYFERWTSYEPRYFNQLRDLNVRLLWNMNQHELRTNLPYIRTIWDVNQRIYSMYPEYSYTWYTFDGLDRNMAYSLSRASYVIVGSGEARRQLVNLFGVHEGKIRIIPFPVPVLPNIQGSFRKDLQEGPYIFYPARFWPQKNHVVIVAALKLLQDDWNIRLRCVFSGPDGGNFGYISRYAEELGVREAIDYVGVVTDEDLAKLYKGAFALVYASATGPDNLPPLEAMSLGCPVITADVLGAREQYGDAVLYFNPMSEKELAERIKTLLNGETDRGQLIARGYDRAVAWTPEDYARSVISIFDEFSMAARAWEKCDSVFTSG